MYKIKRFNIGGANVLSNLGFTP